MISHFQIFKDFLDMLYPRLCITCTERLMSQEKLVCIPCWSDLPATHYHLSPDNKVAQLFWGRVHLKHATSYYAYQKGSRYQRLIHRMKYSGMKELAYHCGQKFGHALKKSVFTEIDLIVPVPLHPDKLKKRGYNQALWIAKGLGETMEKPVEGAYFERKMNTATQTRKTRFERWQNVEEIFEATDPSHFTGKHILLVDDVVTTGSTLEACASEFLKLENTSVSIATLAFAEH